MSHRIALLSLAAATLAAAPALAEIRDYDVPEFDEIDVSAGIKVYYETGVSRYVTVENDKGDFSDIEVKVKDGSLELSRKKKMNWSGKRVPYTVTIGIGSLNEIEASSGSYVEGTGLSGDDASIDVSSGARVVVTSISVGDIALDSSSGASIEASGTCASIIADASSGSSINASDLECTAIDAEVSSGASIRAFATSRVNAEASSGGSVQVSGGATNVTVDKSSGGSVSVS